MKIIKNTWSFYDIFLPVHGSHRMTRPRSSGSLYLNTPVGYERVSLKAGIISSFMRRENFKKNEIFREADEYFFVKKDEQIFVSQKQELLCPFAVLYLK